MEDAVGREADEDGGLGQGYPDDTFEGDQFGAGLCAAEAGADAPREFYDAGDAEGCGEGLEDVDGEGGVAELPF